MKECRRIGRNSPYRDRTVDENMELLNRMKNGEYDDNECCIRLKIDMNDKNRTL